MEKKQFIKLMDEKLKLIRTEYGLTQDKMAAILGISKKTLIEIEKNRKSLGWTSSVALGSIFSDSTILHDAIGGNVSDIIIALAFKNIDVDYPKTWGGKVWWKTISEKKGYRIQQNMFSRHYRILDRENRRIYASFNMGETEAVMDEILKF
ncbi:helix-turn-helix transcriptional regulator [Phosphitispora sp. TUW77]|uniref:helix-turn-helix transcriptional regulator n=1 Tax=Phosphitispora sp. TUW77 TaxID=3152361 RepID=UPI003AB7362D